RKSPPAFRPGERRTKEPDRPGPGQRLPKTAKRRQNPGRDREDHGLLPAAGQPVSTAFNPTRTGLCILKERQDHHRPSLSPQGYRRAIQRRILTGILASAGK